MQSEFENFHLHLNFLHSYQWESNNLCALSRCEMREGSFLDVYRWANCPMKSVTCYPWPTKTQSAAGAQRGVRSAQFKIERPTKAAAIWNSSTSIARWSRLSWMAFARTCSTCSKTSWFRTRRSPRPRSSTWRCAAITTATSANSLLVRCKCDVAAARPGNCPLVSVNFSFLAPCSFISTNNTRPDSSFVLDLCA